jgi:hypothetical protein
MSAPVFIPLDDTLAAKFGDLVSTETFSTLTSNLNYLIDSMPVGSIMPIMYGLQGVPLPDPSMWLLCEGGTVQDQNSKLHGQAIPDLRGNYLKGASSIGLAGRSAGSNTKNFAHSHGGQTQRNSNGSDNGDSDDDYITIYEHSHPISVDLGVKNIEPLNICIRFYLKIR